VLLPSFSIVEKFVNMRKDKEAMSQNQFDLVLKEVELFREMFALSWIPHKFLYYVQDLDDNFEFLDKLARRFTNYILTFSRPQ